MLNGIAPIIIFNFSKSLTSDVSNLIGYGLAGGIPLLQTYASKIPFPPIPLYLDEKLTGLYIENEQKNIDVQTNPATLPDGKQPDVTQKGLNSTVTINLTASRSSVGLTILMALSDQIFQKVTSKEYSITYISGSMTIFDGLLEQFSVTQSRDNSLYNISIVLSKSNSNSTIEAASTVFKAPNTGVLPL
jgi:hypothetical protein